jgi:hypothetical protein
MRARPAPAGEQVDLVGDARAGRVDQVDHRYAGRVRPLDDADDLLHRAGAPGAGLDRGVVRHHAHVPAVDPGVAGDHAVGRKPVGEVVRVQPVLDERALVGQQRDPLTGEELALRGVGGVVALGPTGQHALAYRGQRLAVDRHVVLPLTADPLLNDR